MRTAILVLFMVFSTALFAKNKTHQAIHLKNNISLKSLENTILKKQSGIEFYGSNSVLDPSVFITPVDASLYQGSYFLFSEQFFNNEENSYKNNFSGGGSSAIIFDNEVSSLQNASFEVATIFQQGLFYGFAITLVLLNLVCFFLFDEKTFLWYASVIASSSLLLFFSDGLLGLLGFEVSEGNAFLQSLLWFVTTCLSAIFASKFLNLKEFLPKIKWVSLPFICIAAVALVFNGVTQKPIFSVITNTALFATLSTYFIAGVFLFSRKNYAKFYVIASFIPLLFCFDFFVLNPMGIEFLSTEAFHIKAAVISEILILTYANMFRMQAMKEEHALRQIEMRIFLKRQEALNTRQKTEKLVEDVYLENLIMHYDLDGMEIKLLQYISEGKDNAKIARKLNTTESEIEDLTKELYEKLEIGEQIQQDYRMVDQQPDYIYN
ncbi:MAG: 7TM diverse intracellular signaling domain-containing protein [Flavobacteriaceae bacterium]